MDGRNPHGERSSKLKLQKLKRSSNAQAPIQAACTGWSGVAGYGALFHHVESLQFLLSFEL
jgi:hypothetical protein